MTVLQRKKLIEVSIPLEAINKASAREKSIRHGHPSTLHLWWARRPLAACRAVLFAQLVDDPSAWPDRFPTEAAQEAERKRLHKVIERLVPWAASIDEDILNEARWEIARSVAWALGEEPPAQGNGQAILCYLQEKAPPVYDPFSGGGSIPLEAQRLGLRAFGSDLNPVAVLIGKALVEIPPRFSGIGPVNPISNVKLACGGTWQGRGAEGLADDVRHYGKWMSDEAARCIGDLYPCARLSDGGKATVIAWLWARTVRSPDPAAKGAMVPLVSSFVLTNKEGKKTWVEPVIDPTGSDGYRFEVHTDVLTKGDEERLKKGTKSAKGAAFVCVLTGAAIPRDYVQAEGKADRLGQRLMAIVAEGSRSRIYLSPDDEHEIVARDAEDNPVVLESRATFLSPSTPTRAMITGGVCSAYGLRSWGHLFTARQIVALTVFSDLVDKAREQVLADARSIGFVESTSRLNDSGSGAVAYADAVATYLGLALGRSTDFWSSLATWQNAAKNELVAHTFVRQALPMTWDFAEANPFSSSGGNFVGNLQFVAKSIDAWFPSGGGSITNIDATDNLFSVGPVIVSTDPPYYNNIGYADLSDFFYVWLRRSLASVWPELFRRLITPKDTELVATSFRHGGKAEADAFFMEGIGKALISIKGFSVEDVPIAIYYAFKQSEASEDGLTSAGWSSFLQGIVNAGLSVDGTWPIRTERAARSGAMDANFLASSIVLVCRKRHSDAAIATRAEFVRALKHDMPDAIAAIRQAGVGPVDMQQSVIGPGMGVFTRFARVLEDDDSTMLVRTALSLINRVWEEIENELDANFDPATQVALAWFATYGFEAKPAGELIILANAKDIPLASLFSGGVFHDLRGRAGLIPRVELPASWSPASYKYVTVWECVQHTARALNAADGGAEAAAALVAQMGRKAEDARALAYRLFEIASQKGWSAEALVYNELAEEWRNLEDLAETVPRRIADADVQPLLL
jgi:putative DNA methylase